MKKLSKAEKRKMIKSVLENFDFVKVQKAMKAVNWMWASCDGVPSIWKLKEEAEYLLSEVLADEEMRCISTGGLTADYNGICLSLTFIFDVSETYVYND